MEGSWPLVGRDAEVELLRSCLARGTGIVLAGAAGVGKSRLAHEAEAVGQSCGYAAEWVAATVAVAEVPLGVFVQFDPPEARSAAGASPLASVRTALLKRAGRRRLMLVVDDGHLLDGASAGLVHQLAIGGDAVVVATLRSRASPPDAIVALWKDELCERVEVQPLARREVAELLALVLGGRVDSRSAHQLWWATQGNLLFLRELVRDGLERGVLIEGDARWQWTGEFRAPGRVAELLASLLDGLAPDERRALELVALGEPLDWKALGKLIPITAGESLASLGLIVVAEEHGARRARLDHPLVGEVARDLLVDVRRRRLLRELASVVDAPGSSAFDVLRRASWLMEAGDDVDEDSLVRAAGRCLLIDPPRAERFARAAIRLGAGTPGVIVLAQNLMFSGRAEEADRLLADAIEEACGRDRSSLATMRANNLTFGLGRAFDAVALLDRMLEEVADEDEVPGLLAQRIPMLLFARRIAAALREGERLWADSRVPDGERLRAATGLVAALAINGRPVSGLSLAEDALALLGEGHDDMPFATGQLASGMILCQHRLGQLDVADQITRLGYEQGLADGNDLVRGSCALQLGVSAHWRGQVRTAIEHLREAIDALRRSDVGFLGWASDELRACLAVAGFSETLPEPPWRHALYEPERLRLDAQAVAASGDRVRAAELDEGAAAVALESDMRAEAAFALFDLARHGRAGIAAPRLVSLTSTLEGDLFRTMAAASSALARSDAAGLEDSAARFAMMGFQLFAAELARAAARAYQANRLTARSVRADRMADRWATECEGIRSAMVAQRSTLRDAALTRREQDIAQLVVAGCSNAGIADRLGVSVRTVETHLQRVYTKLGIHGRAELREALTD